MNVYFDKSMFFNLNMYSYYFDKFKLFLYFCLNYIVILGVRLNICIIEFENKRKMGVKL